MKQIISARGAWAAVLVCAATLAFGCSKKGDDKKKDDSAEKSKEGDKGKDTAKSDDKGKDTAKPDDKSAAAKPPPAGANVATNTQGFSQIQTQEPPKVDPKDHGDPSKIAPPDKLPQMRGFTGQAPTGFTVSYTDSSDAQHQQFGQILKDNQVFEKIALSLNSTVKMPRQIDIQLTDCGVVNAFYDPSSHRIIMCYEFMSYLADVFKPVAKDTDELGNAILGAMIFAFFHETGHCLIDQLEIPATGREEDAVDGFSTYILVAGGDASVKMALAGAYWFQLQQQSGGDQTPFSDEHALDMQRFYNILCWIYGSDPDKYKDFVGDGNLPEDRAARCPDEYGKLKKAWEKLLAPYLSDAAAQNAGAPEEPPPATATEHAVACKDAVDHALQLYIASLDEQYKNASQEEIDQVVEQLKQTLPQQEQQLVDKCDKEDWPDKSRQCLMDAQDLASAQKCE